MRESQYAGRYIDSGYTVGTFIKYNVANSCRWSDVYVRQLRRAMEQRERAGVAYRGWSVKGGLAWYSSADHPNVVAYRGQAV